MAKNYSSNYDIKKYSMEVLAPKYFNIDEVNDLNIGLLGYVNDLVANIGEDTFNTITTYINEIFPHLAIMPETIFNNGALFQIDGTMAVPAKCTMYLFVQESEVLEYGTKIRSNSDLHEFYLDSDMIINVEDLHFQPDYNIKINFKKYRNDFIFTAMYDMTAHGGAYRNSISNIINPYIKLKRIYFEKTKYLMLEIETHQVDKLYMDSNVVNTDAVNLPTYTVDFDGHLANFEVFYKAPGATSYTQLTKRLYGTSTVAEPFCYYSMIDEGRLKISFTMRENNFQPEYNSEIKIEYYLSEGAEGNFSSYSGSSVSVIPSSEEYEYNGSVVLFAIPMSSATNGTDPLTLEQLKSAVVEKFSTVNSYTNENDLQLYFANFNITHNSDILFLKKRDDIFERLFSAFIIFKDSTNEIYSTNTLDITINTDDFDTEIEQSDAFLLKPGHLLSYVSGSIDTAELQPGTLSSYTPSGSGFVYTNPYMIYFGKDPNVVGYYLTNANDTYIVDYSYVSEDSLVQFICSSMTVTRNAIEGDMEYKLSVTLTPTTDLDNPMVVETEVPDADPTVTITNTIQVRLIAEDEGVNVAYIDMALESYDLEQGIYVFSASLQTDDYFTLNGKFRVLNMTSVDEGDGRAQHIIPMTDCVLNIETRYQELGSESCTLTNRYSTESHPVTFIEPVSIVRSTATYTYNEDGELNTDTGLVEGGTYHIRIKSVPVVKASTLKDPTVVNNFYKSLKTYFTFIDDSLELITNNFSIDMKFYNTYGKSKNFYVGDDSEQLLDRVNIRIGFRVHNVFGSDPDELIRDIKIFIKNYIETINEKGTNSIYVSNLIRELENNFADIEYLKFAGINDYDTSIQAIENLTVDLSTLTKAERMNYVPEYLTVNLNDVQIEIM